MTTSTTFMHYRSMQNGIVDCKGGATVAIQVQSNDLFDRVVFCVARCNSKDHFSKAIGRNIAAGRLKSFMNGTRDGVPVSSFVLGEDQSVKEAVNACLNEEMASYGLF